MRKRMSARLYTYTRTSRSKLLLLPLRQMWWSIVSYSFTLKPLTLSLRKNRDLTDRWWCVILLFFVFVFSIYFFVLYEYRTKLGDMKPQKGVLFNQFLNRLKKTFSVLSFIKVGKFCISETTLMGWYEVEKGKSHFPLYPLCIYQRVFTYTRFKIKFFCPLTNINRISVSNHKVLCRTLYWLC